jgi:hypothetical protein
MSIWSMVMMEVFGIIAVLLELISTDDFHPITAPLSLLLLSLLLIWLLFIYYFFPDFLETLGIDQLLY